MTIPSRAATVVLLACSSFIGNLPIHPDPGGFAPADPPRPLCGSRKREQHSRFGPHNGLNPRQAPHSGPEQAAAGGRPEPVVDNGEFMDLFLKSTYGELQDAMARPPADRKAWANIYQKAIRLAEMQNLLFFRNRDEVKDPRWGAATAQTRQAAADLANAALISLRNVQKADYEGVRKKYVELAETCNVCHKAFARDAPTIKP